jgi:hypothetical protein
MWKRFYKRLREIPGPVWPIIAVFAPLNYWYDYYHPSGFVFDFAILVWLLIAAIRPDGEDARK